MLSRIAESLFWIGRYIERADGTARVLDVHLQLILEDAWADENAACQSLMAMLGAQLADPSAPATRTEVLDSLAFNRDSPSSIVYSLRAARENARRAREIVSVELWETLNTTYTHLPYRMNNESPHSFFRWVRERIALAAGVTDDSTSRDEVWRFMALGRAIERTDMTARILSTRSLTEDSSPSWTTILGCCGAYDAYLRNYHGDPGGVEAAEFLLLDRLFPRSIIYSIQRAEECIRTIDPITDRAGHSDDALRALGRIRNDIEYRSLPEILTDLPVQMERVQRAILEASDAIHTRFFPTHAEPSWIGETS